MKECRGTLWERGHREIEEVDALPKWRSKREAEIEREDLSYPAKHALSHHPFPEIQMHLMQE